MKRTLMTATAALALAVTPAVGQVLGGETGLGTDTQADTDVTGLDAKTKSEIGTDVKIDTPDVETPDVETDGELDSEAGVGGEFYENEAAASTASDLESEAGIDTPDAETPGVEIGVDAETEAGAEIGDGQGGPYASDRADATARYGDLEGAADAGIDASAAKEGAQTSELNAYVKGQIEKAGPEAEAHMDSAAEADPGQ